MQEPLPQKTFFINFLRSIDINKVHTRPILHQKTRCNNKICIHNRFNFLKFFCVPNIHQPSRFTVSRQDIDPTIAIRPYLFKVKTIYIIHHSLLHRQKLNPILTNQTIYPLSFPYLTNPSNINR
ncbi:hypothetical protein HanIR_Chr09g0393061 [Helianthus annuus]|nr:hypothetical protein HanIR_Chr09g0393061 [Helianthus annuus]